MPKVSVQGTNFSAFADFVEKTDVVITPLLCGFVNIEGGHLSIAGKLFPSCDECYGYSSTSMFVECSQCGRNKDQYIQFRAGFGDGVYPVFELLWDKDVMGTITFCDLGSKCADGVHDVVQAVNDGSVEVNAFAEYFWDYFDNINGDLELNYISTLHSEFDSTWSRKEDPFGTYYFADSGVGEDPRGSLVTVKDIRQGSQDVYLFSERDPQNNNVLIPQVILTLDPKIAHIIGLPSGHSNLDLDAEAANWANSSVLAQVGNNAAAAAAMSMQFETALLLKDYWDELSQLDHFLISLSWRLLYEELSGTDERLAENMMEDFTAERIYLVHRMRGLMTLAKSFYDPDTQEEGPAFHALQAKFAEGSEKASTTLPKSSGGLGGGGNKIGSDKPSSSMGSPSESQGLASSSSLARFCRSCGTAFTDDSHRFCGSCGTAR